MRPSIKQKNNKQKNEHPIHLHAKFYPRSKMDALFCRKKGI